MQLLIIIGSVLQQIDLWFIQHLSMTEIFCIFLELEYLAKDSRSHVIGIKGTSVKCSSWPFTVFSYLLALVTVYVHDKVRALTNQSINVFYQST